MEYYSGSLSEPSLNAKNTYKQTETAILPLVMHRLSAKYPKSAYRPHFYNTGNWFFLADFGKSLSNVIDNIFIMKSKEKLR